MCALSFQYNFCVFLLFVEVCRYIYCFIMIFMYPVGSEEDEIVLSALKQFHVEVLKHYFYCR